MRFTVEEMEPSFSQNSKLLESIYFDDFDKLMHKYKFN